MLVLQIAFFAAIFFAIRKVAVSTLGNPRAAACLPALVHGFTTALGSHVLLDFDIIFDLSNSKQALTYAIQILMCVSIGYFLTDLLAEIERGKELNKVNVVHHLASVSGYILFLRINNGFQIMLLYLFIGECTNLFNILFELYRSSKNYQDKMGYKLVFALFVVAFWIARGFALPYYTACLVWHGNLGVALQHFPYEVLALCFLLVLMTAASWWWLYTMTRKLIDMFTAEKKEAAKTK